MASLKGSFLHMETFNGTTPASGSAWITVVLEAIPNGLGIIMRPNGVGVAGVNYAFDNPIVTGSSVAVYCHGFGLVGSNSGMTDIFNFPYSGVAIYASSV
jgi:hypothetical protein